MAWTIPQIMIVQDTNWGKGCSKLIQNVNLTIFERGRLLHQYGKYYNFIGIDWKVETKCISWKLSAVILNMTHNNTISHSLMIHRFFQLFFFETKYRELSILHFGFQGSVLNLLYHGANHDDNRSDKNFPHLQTISLPLPVWCNTKDEILKETISINIFFDTQYGVIQLSIYIWFPRRCFKLKELDIA